MNIIQRLLIIPITIPSVCLILISSLNFNKTTSIKLLTWVSPKINIGILIPLSYATGIALTSTVALILSKKGYSYNRKLKVNPFSQKKITNDYKYSEENFLNINESYGSEVNDIPPQRDAKDTPPTVSVPYRIIKKNNIVREMNNPTTNRNENNEEINSINKNKEIFNDQDWNENTNDW